MTGPGELELEEPSLIALLPVAAARAGKLVGVSLARRHGEETSLGDSDRDVIMMPVSRTVGERFGFVVANVPLLSRESSSTVGNSIANFSCLFTGWPVSCGSGPNGPDAPSLMISSSPSSVIKGR